jgi:hypothetical protein
LAAPAILYNSLTVTMPVPRVFQPVTGTPVVTNRTITGNTETIAEPRVDIHVHLEFPVSTDTSLLMQVENFYQWASLGKAWAYAHDSSKVIDTLLTADAALGATSVTVTSGTGITIGQVYKLISGPNYQLILVSGVAGTTISFTTTPLNYPFLTGGLFRDKYYFPAILPDGPSFPILRRDAGIKPEPGIAYEIVLDFMEKVA